MSDVKIIGPREPVDWSALGMETVKWKAEQARRERRERIATAAMQGLLASDAVGEVERFARAAVKFADALIAELDETQEDKT